MQNIHWVRLSRTFEEFTMGNATYKDRKENIETCLDNMVVPVKAPKLDTRLISFFERNAIEFSRMDRELIFTDKGANVIVQDEHQMCLFVKIDRLPSNVFLVPGEEQCSILMVNTQGSVLVKFELDVTIEHIHTYYQIFNGSLRINMA